MYSFHCVKSWEDITNQAQLIEDTDIKKQKINELLNITDHQKLQKTT